MRMFPVENVSFRRLDTGNDYDLAERTKRARSQRPTGLPQRPEAP